MHFHVILSGFKNLLNDSKIPLVPLVIFMILSLAWPTLSRDLIKKLNLLRLNMVVSGYNDHSRLRRFLSSDHIR